jgi:hypothetical protein
VIEVAEDLLFLVGDAGPVLKDVKPKKSDPEPPPAPEKKGPRPDEIRRRDAVVDAARTIDDLSDTSTDLRDFIKRRWSGTRVLEESDIIDFSKDARRQRVEDVVDGLDHRVRDRVFGKQNRSVKVVLPRGMARRELKAMSDDDLKAVVERLRARGWTTDQLRKHVAKGLDDERRRIVGSLAPVGD